MAGVGGIGPFDKRSRSSFLIGAILLVAVLFAAYQDRFDPRPISVVDRPADHRWRTRVRTEIAQAKIVRVAERATEQLDQNQAAFSTAERVAWLARLNTFKLEATSIERAARECSDCEPSTLTKLDEE